MTGARDRCRRCFEWTPSASHVFCGAACSAKWETGDREVNPWDLIGDGGRFVAYVTSRRISLLQPRTSREAAEMLGLTLEAWEKSTLVRAMPPPTPILIDYMMSRAIARWLKTRTTDG